MSTLIFPSIISSIVEACITHPLDVIKIHKQTNTTIIYKFKNLYSGFIPRAIGNIPSRSCFLFSQDYLKYIINMSSSSNLQLWSPLLIPIGTGFAQTLVDTPVEVKKINKIMNINNNMIYKGFIPHLGRNIIFLISVYNFRQYGEKQNNNILTKVIYGSIGGICGSYISHPLDTIKTHVQTNKNYKKLKLSDYFRGGNMRASMSMINMFISLSIFELIKKYND